jgi:hypothetical protein
LLSWSRNSRHLWNPDPRFRNQKTRAFVSVLSDMDQINSSYHLNYITFYIILPSMSRTSKQPIWLPLNIVNVLSVFLRPYLTRVNIVDFWHWKFQISFHSPFLMPYQTKRPMHGLLYRVVSFHTIIGTGAVICVTLGFRREGDATCPLLDYYAAYSDNSFLTFRDSISVPSSRAKKFQEGSQSHLVARFYWPFKMGPDRMSRNVAKESPLRCVISQKSTDLEP